MSYKDVSNPYNLRQIIIPGNLTKRFLEQAQSNTLNNIETCGILAGKLVIFLFSIRNINFFYDDYIILCQ